MSKKVLVVGATGFVGSHIARELIGAGHAVSGMGLPLPVNLVSDLEGKLALHPGNVERIEDIDRALGASGAEIVVWSAGHNANAAGLMATGETDSSKALDVNAVGLFNLLEAARRRGIRRAVVTGSLVVYGPASKYATTHVDESAWPQPTTVYGLSKLLGENVAQYFRDRFDMDVTTLRLAVVFGPGRWYGGVVAVLNRLLDEAAVGKVATCEVPPEPFDLVHVKDVAQAVRLAIASAGQLRPVYHLNTLTTTYVELARAIEQQVPGFRIECRQAPAPLVYPLMNFELARRDLGFRPKYDVPLAIEEIFRESRQAR